MQVSTSEYFKDVAEIKSVGLIYIYEIPMYANIAVFTINLTRSVSEKGLKTFKSVPKPSAGDRSGSRANACDKRAHS